MTTEQMIAAIKSSGLKHDVKNCIVDALGKHQSIRNACRQWIKAEFAFRQSPHAYSKATTKIMVDAERRLRKVITGKNELKNAARVINPESVDRAEQGIKKVFADGDRVKRKKK